MGAIVEGGGVGAMFVSSCSFPKVGLVVPHGVLPPLVHGSSTVGPPLVH